MEVLEDYFDGVLRRNPHVATVLGVHDYDSEIPSGSRESVLEEVREARETRDCLGGDTYQERLARSALEYDLFEMEELRLWERDPGAVDAVISFIYPLWARDFTSLGRRIELIADRLEDCPTYVQETRERVVDPVDIWVEDELRAAEQLPGYLQLVADYAGRMERQDVAYRVNEAAEDLLEEIDEYTGWLESLDTDADWRIGEEHMEELLDKRYMPGADEAVALAEKEVERAEETMARAVEKMGYSDPRDAVEALEDDSTSGDVVEAYATEIREVRRFVDENVVKLPEHDGVEVTETPEHLKSLIQSNGYVEPAALDGEPPKYYVTPATEHSRLEILGAAVAEFYPGHHLQEVYPKDSRVASLVGRFNSFGDDFRDGWELYSMDVTAAHGYRTPELDLVRARDRLTAACTAIVDVELQRGGMTVREAADYLAGETGLESKQALARVRSYTRNPGHRVSRLVGAHLLHELRDDVDMKEKDFHDALLRGGGAPVEFHRARLS